MFSEGRGFRRTACAGGVLFFLMLLILLFPLTKTALASGPKTALEVFAQLPTTLFENTPEGLSEEEKQQIIDRGESAFWEVEQLSTQVLVLLSRPFGETRVTLRLFGDENATLAAVGTSGDPMCALELWSVDATGGLVPASTPTEPVVSEFIGQKRLPQGVSPAVLFCLVDEGLEARPLFWAAEGLVDIPISRTVRYVWKNGIFEKNVTARIP